MMNFFPDLAKEFHDEGSMKRAPDKRENRVSRKIDIRLPKMRHVISLHVSTRSSVIDGFESPSKVAPLFRGTYLLSLPSRPLCATVLLPSQQICPLHKCIRCKMLFRVISLLFDMMVIVSFFSGFCLCVLDHAYL